MAGQRSYIAIDLKSFYASVECVERGLDPLTTNLVVADQSRTEKTICLAVSPSLKAYGIPGRARLFEVVQKVKEVNALRQAAAPNRQLTGASSSAPELADYLGKAILTQLERSVQSGQQYRSDAAYIERSMEDFNQQADRLRTAMAEIASSISAISGAVDGAVSGVTAAAGSTRGLAGDMAGIAAGMDTNQEIVGELQRQVDIFANL